MKTILIIAFSDLSRDPRVRRQIHFLRDTYQVIAAGYCDPQIPSVRFIPITTGAKGWRGKLLSIIQLLTHQYDAYYWRQHHVLDAFKNLAPLATEVDVIIANDIDTLPLALRLREGKKAKVLFDAHEYAPRQFEDRVQWRTLWQGFSTALCQRYIPQVDAMTTVCQGIADQYEQDTGIRPVVLLNAPEYVELTPRLRTDQEVTIRMVHHGAAIPSRRIERMIAMMAHLDQRFTLDLYLVSETPNYLEALQQRARMFPQVRVLPPVPSQEIILMLHGYDIGLFLLEPVNFNYLHALPNKFFEFIQARLALAIGPSPEMAALVRAHQLGIVSSDFSPRTMAQCLMQLNHTLINFYKQQSHAVAEAMSARTTRTTLLELVEHLIAS